MPVAGPHAGGFSALAHVGRVALGAVVVSVVVSCGRVGYQSVERPVVDGGGSVELPDARTRDGGLDQARADSPLQAARDMTLADTPSDVRSEPDLESSSSPDLGADRGPVDTQPPADTGAADAAADAVPVDTGPDAAAAPPSLCTDPGPAVLVCEDADGTAPLKEATNGTVARDLVRRRAGRASVHLATQPSMPAANMLWMPIRILSTPLTSGSAYLRAYYFVPSSTRLQDWMVLIELRGGGGRKVSLDVYRNGGLGLETNWSTKPTGTGGAIPRDRWFCAELHVDIHASQGRARALIDGQTVYEHADIDTHFDNGVDFLRAGVLAGAGNGVLDIWMDEILISTAGPIGCD